MPRSLFNLVSVALVHRHAGTYCPFLFSDHRRKFASFLVSKSDKSMDPQNREVPLDYWGQRWYDGKVGFHKDTVNQTLVTYYDLLTDGKQRRFLLPLCGKTLDLKWLYDQGHTVIGVEGVEKAVQEFFEESKLEPIIEEKKEDGCKVYSTEDKRLQIYICNFFTFSRAMCQMSFDAVFDRGSLTALSRPDWNRYATLLGDLIETKGKILLEVYEYEISKFGGPPFLIKMDDVQNLYSEKFEIKFLRSFDCWQKRHKEEMGLGSFMAMNYLLTRN